MPAGVLAELRILASTDFDSRSILTVVLCGDGRLTEQFRSDELLPSPAASAPGSPSTTSSPRSCSIGSAMSSPPPASRSS